MADKTDNPIVPKRTIIQIMPASPNQWALYATSGGPMHVPVVAWALYDEQATERDDDGKVTRTMGEPMRLCAPMVQDFGGLELAVESGNFMGTRVGDYVEWDGLTFTVARAGQSPLDHLDAEVAHELKRLDDEAEKMVKGA